MSIAIVLHSSLQSIVAQNAFETYRFVLVVDVIVQLGVLAVDGILAATIFGSSKGTLPQAVGVVSFDVALQLLAVLEQRRR